MIRSLTLFFLLVVLLLFPGCAPVKQQAPPPPPVVASVAEKKNIPKYIETLGHFAAYNTVNIQAQVQGELTGLYFTEGQTVAKGDLLFTIDSAPYQAVLDKAVATLQQNKAILAYNIDRADRYSFLVGDDFISKLEYDQYVSDVDAYRALVQENEAEIASAQINVGYCTLTSPIEGVTGKRLIDVGNIITDAGSKLLVVNQINPLFIDFSVPERYFDLVHSQFLLHSIPIEIEVPNTNLRTMASLQMLDNTINPKTGMIALRGILHNDESLFWPQQFVRVRMIIDTIVDAVMVPPDAVLQGSIGSFVWRIDDNETVTPVVVELGERYEGEVQITKGLQSGDRIVSKGQLPLRKGMKVTIQP